MKNSILKSLLGLLILVIVGVIGLASVQPNNYRVVRSIEINASSDTVFQKIADLKDWIKWSPWIKRDPEMKITFSDVTTGVGAFSAWESKTEGSGKQTISENNPGKSLKIDLEFYAPFEGTAKTDFMIETVSDGVAKLTWSMDGVNKGIVEKFFYAVMDFDSMIGKDYEAGLSDIKGLAEQQ